MDSRIILSTADFSANNIGRYVELGDFTKKVLAKQTQYNLDSTEAADLDVFLSFLATNGYIGGSSPLLQYLVIPALAADHDELLYNLAEVDGNGYPVNKMSDAEKNANTKVFLTYGSGKVKGLTLNQSSSITQTEWNNCQEQHINGLLTKNSQYPSFSICAYFDEMNAASAPTLITLGSGYSARIAKAYFGIWSTNVPGNYVKAEVSSLGSGFVGMTYDASNNTISTLLDNGSVSAQTDVANIGSVKTGSGDNFDNLLFDSFLYQSKLKMPFCCVGLNMSSQQMSELRTAVQNLLTHING